MQSIWDDHHSPLPPDEVERDLGPDAQICRRCTYWHRLDKLKGRCLISGDLASRPITHPEDGCEEFIGRMRL